MQLVLCPPKDREHIPPGIYGPPVAISSRESGMLRHPSCSKIPVEGGVPEPFEGDKNEEGAILKCMYARVRTTSTERHECVSSLVGRVLVTDSKPGSSSHAHFLAAMVADHVKEKSIYLGLAFPGTPAHIDKSHRGSQHRAPMRSRNTKNTDVNQAAEALVSQSRRRSNQACGQYRARAALAKTKVQIRRHHAAEMAATEKIRVWTSESRGV